MIPINKELSRSVENFNYGWKFFKGDAINAYQINYNDENWREVDLPHDWSIEGPFDKKWASSTGYLPGGIGWYRKRFKIAKSDSDRRYFIYFEGVYNNSQVWINEKSLGERPNGYVSFYYEISPYINFGSENVIAVKVNHSKYADSRWYTGSGIYRNVKLIKTNAIYIKPWGVYTRPHLKSNKGIVDFDITLKSEKATVSSITVINELYYHKEIIGQNEVSLEIKSNKELIVNGKIEVENPKVWDIDSPELYTLVSIVKDEKQVLDEVETSIGFRVLRFDAKFGFFLNGRNMKLKGICMHHDAGCLGAAVPRDVLNNRLSVLKELGCNAIRTSHNAFAPDFYELCDKKGFLVIDEVFDEWEAPKKKWIKGWNIGEPVKDGYAEYFKDWAKIDLRDQILRDRNHPCIIMWSIGNEVDYPNDPYSHEILNTEKNPQTSAKFDNRLPYAGRLGEIAKDLVSVVKKFDNNRPVTAGLASALMSNEIGYADALDVVGYNYQEYQYNVDHAKYPERIIYGSENGMTLQAWQAVIENNYVMGQFLWTGFEYLGEAAKYPMRNSISGLIDLAGHKKPEYFFRQSLWSDKPIVFIGVSEQRKNKNYIRAHQNIHPHWNWSNNQLLKVTVFSNCQEVELCLNNTSMGIKRLADAPERELNWNTNFKAGELRAIGRNNGKVVASYKLDTAGEPNQLIVRSYKVKLRANNQDIAHLEVIIADEKGFLVYSANNKISCQISGPVRLLGMEDANVKNTENYKDLEQNAFKGRLLAYIQSLNRTGKGTIVFSSSGIKSCKIVIDVVEMNESNID
ncbi:MAG: glycoside hydrolase family 2 protein [Candidatus Lokiarchaeota archaeon]|nr:glycoside hydrolase family 2 protein [Candidatus Lokiarchaeota archaeon]